jgi:Arc/MetJ family transcription regulator
MGSKFGSNERMNKKLKKCNKYFKMRTNIEIDDKLLEEAIKLTGSKNKKEMVNRALEEIIKLEKRKQLRALRGKVKWEGNLDKMRTYDKWDNH